MWRPPVYLEDHRPLFTTGFLCCLGVRGWGLINGLVLKDESPVLAGSVVAETTDLGLLLVPAGLKVTFATVRRAWLRG